MSDNATLQEQYAMACRANWVLHFVGAAWTYIGLFFFFHFSLLSFIAFPVSLCLVLSKLKDIQDNKAIRAELLERIRTERD